ncbi:MAG: TVP38/TMEM64 family protein [Alphaproteobacteria bacterium]|nr:MAG: TVP38/TMEM64 family protein [Alphaproteobacteria bacterium]
MRAPPKGAAQRGDAPSRLRAGRILPLAAVVLVLAIAWRAGWLDLVSLSSLIRHRAALADQVAAHPVMSYVAYFLVYAGLVAVSFPGASLLTVTSGFLFGGIAGGSVSVAAASAGAVAIFLLARGSLGDLLQARAGPFVARMVDGFNRNAFNYLLFLRLTPVFPFWVVNIVPALLNMRLLPYAAATAIGIIPATFAYAHVGAGLDSIIAAQERAAPGCAEAGTCAVDPSALVTPQVVVAMGGLAVLAVLPVLIGRWRARAGGRPEGQPGD